ncbi:MAG: transcriptional repressor [Clostridia bacterium]|nr:transcriptional repressor [Clostridia bacterium]
MKNYSRQREAILTTLRSTNTHPTANWIYTEVRKEIPNISLGTVYRNLSALTEAGDILCINLGNGTDRFDGDISAHLHLHCNCCDEIEDVQLEKNAFLKIAKERGFIPRNSIYVIEGICKKCNLKTILNGGN